MYRILSHSISLFDEHLAGRSAAVYSVSTPAAPPAEPQVDPAAPDVEPDAPPGSPKEKPGLDPFEPAWPPGRTEPQPKARRASTCT